MTMFEDGVKRAGLEEKLKPRDIAEIPAERCIAENQEAGCCSFLSDGESGLFATHHMKI